VTGGSSGIGKAMVEMLAEQGINVVIVAVPDAALEHTTKELQERYWLAGAG
jgi:NAD(P)-dependent dehydrogenase (short-subunit alcohol dehydrogenase family)